jgi:serine phosphatase RsbU (regulator of sigma subunit)
VDQELEKPDGVLFLFNGDPSDGLRRQFFESYRRGIPIGALCLGEPAAGDSIYSRLKDRGSWWVFRTAAEAREIIGGPVRKWILDIRRDTPLFQTGEELLESYGDIGTGQLDPVSLDRAVEVMARRGFICLGGPLGAGKTTMARYLLSESAAEGLTPVEIITGDLFVPSVESLLTGPEECAVFWDLDTLRRFTGLWSTHLWSVALSLMIRATETRRRLILASSDDRLDGIFASYGDAFIRLPEPSEKREWRLEQGRQALLKLSEMDPIVMAEHLLLAVFDPEVPESVFRNTLQRLWERLYVIQSGRFPSRGELESLYAGTAAAAGRLPFRRFRLSGETYLTSGDTTMLTAIDTALESLLKRRSPIIHAMNDVLLSSSEARVRKAGYAMAHFYPLFAPEDRAALLYSIAREEDSNILWDVLTVLLRDPATADDGVLSICEYIARSGDAGARRALAEACARPWVREDPRTNGLVDMVVGDSKPSVRASFMRGVAMWGEPSDSGGFYNRLLTDTALEVRAELVTCLGARFPRIEKRELLILNEILAGDDKRFLRNLAWGLLNRSPEEFSREFTDLLWLILERMPPGGKGMVARQIGGRLRYFDSDVREALVSNLEKEEDRTAIVLCLLMNYSWLTPDEAARLWSLALGSVVSDSGFASLVLSYFNAFDPGKRKQLIRAVLASEEYRGREALSQLLARMRWDLAEVSLEVCSEIAELGTIEERARLPWFLLWNEASFHGEVRSILGKLVSDPSPVVRSALPRAVLKQGTSGDLASWILSSLAGDPERAVRAFTGEALGRLCPDFGPECHSILESLFSDTDASVRARTLGGILDSTRIPRAARLDLLGRAASDSSALVRRELINGFSMHPDLLVEKGSEEILSSLLSDSDEKARIEAVKLVTANPSLLASDSLKRRLPDLLLNRYSTGATIYEELNAAREIQKEFLPESPPRLESYDIEFFYSPAREVGGDYYDFFTLPEDNLGLAVGDVSGKGIPAALTMASLKGNLAGQVRNLYSISDIVGRVNEALTTVDEGINLVGLFYGVLNIHTGILTYVNAGHNPPILVKREGQTKLLTEGGLLLGASASARYEHGVVSMETADVLVLYTDGITEAFDPDGEEFGLRALAELCVSSRDLSSKQMVARVLDAVNRHSAGAPRADDQTLVIIRHR